MNYEMSHHLLPPTEPPKAHGGFCDAYEGVFSVKVCIKRLRVATVDNNYGKVKEVRLLYGFRYIIIPDEFRSSSARKLLCGKI